jgi:hypothetical protein
VIGAPFWSELSFLAALGVPGAYFSAGDATYRDPHEDRVEIEEFLDAARTLALFIADQCGVEPAAPLTRPVDEPAA